MNITERLYKMTERRKLAEIIGSPYNLLPQGVLIFVNKYGFNSFEDFAQWKKVNKILTSDQLHDEIMTAVMES